jgi:hypothetical protein
MARTGRSGCGGHPGAGPGAILQVRCCHDKEASMLLLSSKGNDYDEVDDKGLLTDLLHIGECCGISYRTLLLLSC